jgi:hypothetical protein
MARPTSGAEQLDLARAQVKSALSAAQLRATQAVLLPLEFGLTLEQTALAVGRSVGATCRMRMSFCAVASGEQAPTRPKTALRNRAKTTLAEEAAALDKVLNDAQQGGGLIIPRLKPQIEAALGKTMALSGIYRMLHQHKWRKLAPDTPREIPPHVKCGKKLLESINKLVANFDIQQPVRLMFQDEARFGRINDCRY